jgi:hypothetical protein
LLLRPTTQLGCWRFCPRQILIEALTLALHCADHVLAGGQCLAQTRIAKRVDFAFGFFAQAIKRQPPVIGEREMDLDADSFMIGQPSALATSSSFSIASTSLRASTIEQSPFGHRQRKSGTARETTTIPRTRPRFVSEGRNVSEPEWINATRLLMSKPGRLDTVRRQSR